MGCQLSVCASSPEADAKQVNINKIEEEINISNKKQIENNNISSSNNNIPNPNTNPPAPPPPSGGPIQATTSINNKVMVTESNVIQATQGNQIYQGKENNTLGGQMSGEIHKTEEKEKRESLGRINSKIGRELSGVSQKSGGNNVNVNVNTSLNENKKTKKVMADSLNIKIGPEIFVSLKKGSLADNYEVGKVLGEGAFGKVCLVTHKTTKMQRAMKSMKKSSLLKEEESKMFAEMNILKDLDHPNIVKLYELFQDEENYYLITEYCSGGELFDRIKSMNYFSEKLAAEYMKQILGAVLYCHSKNIVHRDLKPENLIFDSNSSKATLKVIDFGTSRKFDSLTKMTKRLGTPYYIAPEVLNKNYNEKCDVWSCGVILYILLCGYPPFTGKSEDDILKKVKIGKFSYDPEDWGKVSEEAIDLINKMLTYDPKQRIGAKDALNHAFIQKNSSNAPLNEKVLNNLGSFHQKTKLQAAIYTFIATQILSQNEKNELQKTFQALDKDGDGRLSMDELIEGYIKIYGEAEREKVTKLSNSIISKVDQNFSGSIDFTEFLIAALNEDKLLNKKKMEQTFKMFDADGNGFITKEELGVIMGGIPIDEATWKAILEETDTNKDGKISMEEFSELLMRKFDD